MIRQRVSAAKAHSMLCICEPKPQRERPTSRAAAPTLYQGAGSPPTAIVRDLDVTEVVFGGPQSLTLLEPHSARDSEREGAVPAA